MLENLSKIGLTVSIMGSLNGRKRLQKSIYILKSLGFDYSESFKWGNYGVYSQELTSEVQTLVEAGYLAEKTEPDSSYSYALTKEGRKFIEQQPSALSRCAELETVVRMLNEKPVGDLDLFSSCLFVWGADQSTDQMVDLVHYLKPHFPKKKVRAHVELADRLTRERVREDRTKLLAKL